jgi:hypothetical protein
LRAARGAALLLVVQRREPGAARAQARGERARQPHVFAFFRKKNEKNEKRRLPVELTTLRFFCACSSLRRLLVLVLRSTAAPGKQAHTRLS